MDVQYSLIKGTKFTSFHNDYACFMVKFQVIECINYFFISTTSYSIII